MPPRSNARSHDRSTWLVDIIRPKPALRVQKTRPEFRPAVPENLVRARAAPVEAVRVVPSVEVPCAEQAPTGTPSAAPAPPDAQSDRSALVSGIIDKLLFETSPLDRTDEVRIAQAARQRSRLYVTTDLVDMRSLLAQLGVEMKTPPASAPSPEPSQVPPARPLLTAPTAASSAAMWAEEPAPPAPQPQSEALTLPAEAGVSPRAALALYIGAALLGVLAALWVSDDALSTALAPTVRWLAAILQTR